MRILQIETPSDIGLLKRYIVTKVREEREANSDLSSEDEQTSDEEDCSDNSEIEEMSLLTIS